MQPVMERLAKEGMQFTGAYSGNAVCAPTRCVLMTGKHPGHVPVRANKSRNGRLPTPAGTTTVATILKGAGYATGGFGKWGLGNVNTTGVPEKQGFDLWYGYYDQARAHNYFPEFLIRNSKEVSLDGNKGGKRSLYEGGIRAPFVAWWPGKVKAGSTSDLLTSSVDLMATAADIAGVKVPAATDGISILPTMLGEEQTAKHEWLYFEIYEGPFQQCWSNPERPPHCSKASSPNPARCPPCHPARIVALAERASRPKGLCRLDTSRRRPGGGRLPETRHLQGQSPGGGRVPCGRKPLAHAGHPAPADA